MSFNVSGSSPQTGNASPLNPAIIREAVAAPHTQAGLQPPPDHPALALQDTDSSAVNPLLTQQPGIQADARQLTENPQTVSFPPNREAQEGLSFASIFSAIGLLAAGAPSKSYGPVIQQVDQDFQTRRQGGTPPEPPKKIKTEAASENVQQEQVSRTQPPATGQANPQLPFVGPERRSQEPESSEFQ